MPTQVGDLTTVTGLIVVLLIVVQLLKRYLEERFIPLYSIGIGMLIAIGSTLATGPPGWVPIGNALLTGFLAGAAAAGVYDAQQPLGILRPRGN